MRRTQKVIGIGLSIALILFGAVWYLHGRNFGILSPAGEIASKEKQLIVFASLLSLVVVIPVFILLFSFAWKYREGNKKPVSYTPEHGGSPLLEAIWWLVPSILLAILSVLIWRSSHELDPYKALASSKKPITVQVVAMDWKWLFIYPEEHVASVNYLPLPVDTPINFQLTSDGPMNSMWIPQLGGQVYAMTGMNTQLHLVANKTGDYNGVSANISGRGFAGMKFVAHVTNPKAYETWLETARKNSPSLDSATYAKLAKPSENNTPATYLLTKHDLYDTIVMKYMAPTETNTPETHTHDMANMPGMSQ